MSELRPVVNCGTGEFSGSPVYFSQLGIQARTLSPHPGVRCTFPSQTGLLETVALRRPSGDSRWRAVVHVLRSSVDALASAVFPASCRLCYIPLARLSLAPVCDSCWQSLRPQSGSLCLHCGEALGPHAFASEERAPGDWLCRPCRLAPPAFDRAVAWGLYGGALRELIHLLKYERMEPIAEPLGDRIAQQLASVPGLPSSLTLVPVPLFAAKRRERGFNQAEQLGRAVARAGRRYGLSLQIEPDLLVRQRATESQAGLSASGRRRNLQGAFAVRDPAKKSVASRKLLAGRDLLLIDDIYTTGATARACSSALRQAGASQVWVATAARAQRADLVEAPLRVEVPMEDDVAFWS